MDEQFGFNVFIIIICGSTVLGALTMIGLALWSSNRISCIELVGAGGLLIIFLGLLTIPGGFAPAFVLFGIPLVYALVRFGFTTCGNRTIKQLRQEDYNACERILARDPRNGAAQVKYAELLEEDGRIPEAMEAYQQAVALDPSNDFLKRKYQRLEEKIAFEESGQMRCPGCRTIVQRDTGICWKCGRVIDTQRALITRFKRLTISGRLAAASFLASLTLIFVTLCSYFDEGSPAKDALKTTLIWFGIFAAAGCAYWFWTQYRKVLNDEEYERE